jgi:hypothetical protein
MRHLLNLVEDKKRSSVIGVLKEQPGGFPLRLDPLRSAERGLVGAGKDVRNSGLRNDLGHQRRLPDLPRSTDHLDEPPRFAEATYQLGGLGPGNPDSSCN